MVEPIESRYFSGNILLSQLEPSLLLLSIAIFSVNMDTTGSFLPGSYVRKGSAFLTRCEVRNSVVFYELRVCLIIDSLLR